MMVDGRWLMVKKVGHCIGVDILQQLIVDHADWGGAAAGQTFNELNADISIFANENWIVVGTIMATGNARCRAKVFHNTIASGHGTAKRPANPNMRFGGAFLPQHRIERNKLEDVDRL